jgi:hypothetical protein
MWPALGQCATPRRGNGRCPPFPVSAGARLYPPRPLASATRRPELELGGRGDRRAADRELRGRPASTGRKTNVAIPPPSPSAPTPPPKTSARSRGPSHRPQPNPPGSEPTGLPGRVKQVRAPYTREGRPRPAATTPGRHPKRKITLGAAGPGRAGARRRATGSTRLDRPQNQRRDTKTGISEFDGVITGFARRPAQPTLSVPHKSRTGPPRACPGGRRRASTIGPSD